MRIEKMTATFGTLSRDTLELKPGLNVIESGNESGKTTWCAFIRAMLYGVNTSERGRAGATPDKVRYLPWSGAGMEGTMTVSHGGESYELVRLTRQGVLGECSATRVGTAEPVPELSGKSPGDALIGASEDVFRRSAFISHTAMRVDNSSELEKRISELVSSGEENYSYDEAHERVMKLKKRIRNARGGGEIPEADREAERLAGELRAIEEASESSVRSERERLGLIAAAERRRMPSFLSHRSFSTMYFSIFSAAAMRPSLSRSERTELSLASSMARSSPA
ncbi:MAG: AAA family ATPase, partial [Oscillospiraceae bacterium]|nr:AAA family ATPase [Oscillospiraceae bacterium]